MKALLLSARSYTSKKTGEVGTTGCIIYVRPDGTVEAKQIFGFDLTKFAIGTIINVEFDPNGFLMSMDTIGTCESFGFLVEDLS